MQGKQGPRQEAAGKRRRCSPETRREEILRAAVSLFASQGFTRTTTREIAHAAGIAEGTIYTYFASKEEVLLAFLQPLMSFSLLDPFPQHGLPDDAGVIRQFLSERFALWVGNRELMKVVISEALFNQVLSDGVISLLYTSIDRFAEYLARRSAEGAFITTDTLMAARGLVGQAFALFLQCSLLRNDPPPVICWTEVAETLTGLFLHGIAVRREEGRE